ncbi:hypothetical protein TNCV_1110621 [Trichonephila clavipes]|nr:hypothetical protein TNCV_1110621 [Trichonephila clavipes]
MHLSNVWGISAVRVKIANQVKRDISFSGGQAPVHEWYEGNRSGAALIGASRRRDQAILLVWLRGGQTRAQRHVAVL